MRIAVLVSGGGTNLQSIIDAIQEGMLFDISISLVLSSNPEAFALERARKMNIPTVVLSPKDYPEQSDYERKMLQTLANAHIDLLVLAGFLSLLGPELIRAYNNRIINIHPSLIPSFCGPGMYGMQPHIAALDRGVKVSGATVHFVNAQYDEGPILLQKAIDILPEDTPESLQKRIMIECEQVLLPAAIRLIADHRVLFKNNKVIVLAEGAPAGKERK